MRKLCTIILLCFPVFVFSQGRLRYTYDSAGNRISRVPTNMYLSSIDEDVDIQEREIAEEDFREEESMLQRKISIYPNPTKGKLKISINMFSTEDRCDMELYTLDGILVASTRVSKETTTLDITTQKAGLYLLHITLNGKKTVWKIIKK